ncbi:MAG TPA: peptidoglycan-binding domain-containing protein [Chthoniobacterales bacterium]
MPSYPTPLLIIVSLLVSGGSLFGDEQTRKAQGELRKRHLFYGEITGQPSPALTAAIEHYQKKKGFARTGQLDYETCGSLGMTCGGLQSTPTPFVMANNGEARGANGETLSLALPEDPSTQFDRVLTDRDRLVLTLLGSDYQSAARDVGDSKSPSRVRKHRVAPPKEKNPFVMALWSVDHAMKRLLGDSSTTKKKSVAAKRL